eukprot:SAG31_NODE_3132_length_4639_cov_3.668502_5_plen_48_part_00
MEYMEFQSQIHDGNLSNAYVLHDDENDVAAVAGIVGVAGVVAGVVLC